MRQGTTREELIALIQSSPVTPAGDWLTNLCLYQPPPILAKILYLNELYQRVLHLPGDIFEFGVWWGAEPLAPREPAHGLRALQPRAPSGRL